MNALHSSHAAWDLTRWRGLSGSLRARVITTLAEVELSQAEARHRRAEPQHRRRQAAADERLFREIGTRRHDSLRAYRREIGLL
jgi:hypothetical protein